MIQMEKDGAELNDKLAEISRLRRSDEVKVAQRMAQASDMLDTELRILRRAEREGRRLIEQGITLDKLNEILRMGDNYDA